MKGNRTRPLGDAHTINYGVHVIGYSLDPGIQRPYGASSSIRFRSLDREYAFEPSVFASDNWTISEKLSLEGGIRLSGFTALTPDSFYFGPEFRLSGKYALRDSFSLKGGFNMSDSDLRP